jgi:tetratricopeptide (TPR) repeat protein
MTRAARAAAALVAALAAGCASPVDPAVVEAAHRDLDALAARSRPDADPATVDVLLAPDEAFLGRLGRDAVPSLVRAVETLDRVLGPEVGLRFRVGGAELFTPTPGAEDLRRILWEARLGLERGSCDVVAAFTGQRCGDRAGTAEPRLRLLLCADATDPERNLLHEAAHLFGAQDYPRGHPGYATPTLMSYDSDQPRTLAFDPANLARIRARRGKLPVPEHDMVPLTFATRRYWRPGAANDVFLEAFLCAESRTMHAEGVAPAEAFLAAHPGNPVGLWALGECRRALRQGDAATAHFRDALLGIAEAPMRDGLHRHAALEIAKLAVDAIDGLEVLRPEVESVLVLLSKEYAADPELLDLRASLRARAGDRAAAEALYREAAAAAPGETYPWRHLAALGRSEGDPLLWLEAWRGALAADPLDPVLAIRWVEEWLEEYPDLILSDDGRRDAERAFVAAEAAFPNWTRPAELRHEIRSRRP